MGRRHRRGGITLVTASGRPGAIRVAVVAGKKVGSAVERNRAKRRLREALRRVSLPVGRDYLVIASASVNQADFTRLVSWLAGAVDAEEEAKGEQ
ncbi:MAG: ribonuclease P protein component [Actinomycetota bacterium]|nr:ribonuclease P protein component [Actinomycetota bacterium]